jgi:hypothetical protein
MSTLRDTINAKRRYTFPVAILLGIALSLLHDAVQLLFLPLAEWARVTFIVGAQETFIAEVLVNISFQAITMGMASVAILMLLPRLLDIRSMKYPIILFLSYMILFLLWVPLGLIVGFEPELLPALHLLPFVVLVSTLVFFALVHLMVGKPHGLSVTSELGFKMMKCPKCNVRIPFSAVHMEFPCHKCGTLLTSNALLVSMVAIPIALFTRTYINRFYCTSTTSVTASPLPSFCSDWILFPVAVVIALLILLLFIRIQGPKS